MKIVKGTMITLAPAGAQPALVGVGKGGPRLAELQVRVGGFIETVPGFTSIKYPRDGAARRCVAFANEDGKRFNLPRNDLADLFWREALLRDYGVPSPAPDYLVGTIVVLCGDDEFMRSLRDEGE